MELPFQNIFVYLFIAVMVALIIYKITHKHGIFLEAFGLLNGILFLIINQNSLVQLHKHSKKEELIVTTTDEPAKPPQIIVNDTTYEVDATPVHLPSGRSTVDEYYNGDFDVGQNEAQRLVKAGINGRNTRCPTDLDDARISNAYTRYARRRNPQTRIDPVTAAHFADQVYKEDEAWYNDF